MPDFSKSISVIIPAYNIEDLLEKCVDSVAAQDYPKDLLQIIVVDDGSTDGTPGKADELADKYSNVQVIHKKNGGSSSARNVGIDAATGDYLGFVDSDDYISGIMYSSMMEAAMRTGADMIQIA
ncbi:MAG: glycosyltransferase, partial [Butyrivibrio sp.]|nr:glycosyltransferase [Butyrivibrio sp.]